MNYFDKNKLLTISVVLLVLINLGILGILWFDRPPKHFPEMMPPGERMDPPHRLPPNERMQRGRGPKEFLIEELEFDEKQKKEYEKLVEDHQAEMKNIRDKIRNEKEELWNTLSNPESDITKAEKIAAEIGEDQKETELITYRHFQKVRDLCTEVQKKKFDKVIKEALKMMGPEVSPNPPPPAPLN